MALDSIPTSVLQLIGNTPMVRLDRFFRDARCTVLGKCDFMNPAGSVKDRIGHAMIEAAEREGKIAPGGTIVEATAGNTGLGLCIAAAIKGYKVICVMPDKMSQEKVNLVRAFGARVVVTPTVDKEHPEFYTTVAKRIAKETPNALYIGQFQNDSNPQAHYDTTGPEIWDQTEGKVSAFIASSGTGGTMTGVSRFLKEKNPDITFVMADPEGSIYAHYVNNGNLDGPTGSYKVEGIGNDYLPSPADYSLIDMGYTIPDRESFAAARRLARVEGLFCGGSTGSNLAAARRYIREHNPGPDEVVVVFLCDTGERYLSKVFNDDWMRENQFMGSSGATTAADLLFEKEANAPQLVSATPRTPLRDVVSQVKEYDLSQVPVFDGGKLVGAVTENRILDAHLAGKSIDDLSVADVMGDALATVSREATAQEMLALMKEQGQDAVLVPSGDGWEILSRFDLLQAL